MQKRLGQDKEHYDLTQTQRLISNMAASYNHAAVSVEMCPPGKSGALVLLTVKRSV